MENKNEILNNNANKINQNNNKDEEDKNVNYGELIPKTKLLINKNFKDIFKNVPDNNTIIIEPKNNENRNVFLNSNSINNQNNNDNNFISNNFGKFNIFNNDNEEGNNTRIVLKSLNLESNNNTLIVIMD